MSMPLKELMKRVTYRDIKEYPYLITAGHLNNLYRNSTQRIIASYVRSSQDSCLKLCVRALALTGSKYDLYWCKFSRKISQKITYPITDTVDLIRNITVYGGSYAKFNNLNMQWHEDEQVWKLPEYNESNPLFVVGLRSFYLETDGEHFYCHLGIVAPIELRLKCADIVLDRKS